MPISENIPQLPFFFSWNIVQGCVFRCRVEINNTDGTPMDLTAATFRAELRDAAGVLRANGASGAPDEISVAVAANAVSFTMTGAQTALLTTDRYTFSADMDVGGDRWPLVVLALARIPQLILGS